MLPYFLQDWSVAQLRTRILLAVRRERGGLPEPLRLISPRPLARRGRVQNSRSSPLSYLPMPR